MIHKLLEVHSLQLEKEKECSRSVKCSYSVLERRSVPDFYTEIPGLAVLFLYYSQHWTLHAPQ